MVANAVQPSPTRNALVGVGLQHQKVYVYYNHRRTNNVPPKKHPLPVHQLAQREKPYPLLKSDANPLNRRPHRNRPPQPFKPLNWRLVPPNAYPPLHPRNQPLRPPPPLQQPQVRLIGKHGAHNVRHQLARGLGLQKPVGLLQLAVSRPLKPLVPKLAPPLARQIVLLLKPPPLPNAPFRPLRNRVHQPHKKPHLPLVPPLHVL